MITVITLMYQHDCSDVLLMVRCTHTVAHLKCFQRSKITQVHGAEEIRERKDINEGQMSINHVSLLISCFHMVCHYHLSASVK